MEKKECHVNVNEFRFSGFEQSFSKPQNFEFVCVCVIFKLVLVHRKMLNNFIIIVTKERCLHS